MCASDLRKTGPRYDDPEPGDPPQRPRGGRLWMVLLAVLVACSDGSASPKDRDLMYGWNKPSAKEKRRYLGQPGASRDRSQRPPGRGTRGGGLPRPKGEGKRPDSGDPWHWLRRVAGLLPRPAHVR